MIKSFCLSLNWKYVLYEYFCKVLITL
jgi:hypothetical protein